MRRVFLILACALLTTPALAQINWVAFEQLSFEGTNKTFTSTLISPPGRPQATVAVCRLQGNEIRYRVDGGTATTTSGTQLETNDTLTISNHAYLVLFNASTTGTGTSALNCTYYAQ